MQHRHGPRRAVITDPCARYLLYGAFTRPCPICAAVLTDTHNGSKLCYINYALIKLSNSFKRWGVVTPCILLGCGKDEVESDSYKLQEFLKLWSLCHPGPESARGLAVPGSLGWCSEHTPPALHFREVPCAAHVHCYQISLAECHGSSSHTFPGEETARGRDRARAPNPAWRYRHACLPSK